MCGFPTHPTSRGGNAAGSSTMHECAELCVTAREHRTWEICHVYHKQAAICLGGTVPRPSRSVYANTFLTNSCGKARSETRIRGQLTGPGQGPSGLSTAACPNSLHTGTQARNQLEDGAARPGGLFISAGVPVVPVPYRRDTLGYRAFGTQPGRIPGSICA